MSDTDLSVLSLPQNVIAKYYL